MMKVRLLTWSVSMAVGCAITATAYADNFLAPDSASRVAQYLTQQNNGTLRNGDNVWLRVRDGFQLGEVNSELVRRHERMYSKNPESFRRMLTRSHRYLFHIINEVERRGMPTEIALLPLVESAFNAQAMSPVGASGLWQFMPATGRQYGLEQTWWYDGRRDVTAATRAALDYLENLHAMFGDWNLALASYNWGEGNVSRAIARNRARGLPEDFENLSLPAETRNYVPKLLAVRNILAEPQRFSVRLEKLPNKPYFVAISPGKHMDLEVAAKLAETTEEEVRFLNPGFNRPVLAHKTGRQILIPAAKSERFHENLARFSAPLMNWQPYVAQVDDTAEDIAQRFGMDLDILKRTNGLTNLRIQPGQPLLVAAQQTKETPNADLPETSVVSAETTTVANADNRILDLNVSTSADSRHVVQQGETLPDIAKRYRVSVADLKALNRLESDTLTANQVLKIGVQQAKTTQQPDT